MGIAWLIRPDLTLGDDGQWLLAIIRSRKSADEMSMEIPA
jgi:hypothetical protein